MTKSLWVYYPSAMYSKPIPSYTFTFFFTCLVFETLSLPLPHFSPSPHPRFHKPYRQSKTFLNIQAVRSSAVFCSKAVLITPPSSSMQFLSFFDVLPSAPTTTRLTLMFLMFHILLISLFISWYLSFFSFSFSRTIMSPSIAISIMTQLLSFLFTTTMSGFLALSLCHIGS